MAGEGFARQHRAAIPVGGDFDHGGGFETAAARWGRTSARRGAGRRFRLARSRLGAAAVFRKRFAGENDGEILRGHAARRAALRKGDRFGRGRFLDNLGRFKRGLIGAGATSAETAAATAMPAASATFSAAIATTILTPVGTAVGAVVAAVAAAWGLGCGKIGCGLLRNGASCARFSRFAGLTLFPWLARVARLTASAVTAIAAGIAALEVGRILFLLLEEVGDVEKGVAFESNIDKRGLHAGKNPGDTALVNGAG